MKKITDENWWEPLTETEEQELLVAGLRMYRFWSPRIAHFPRLRNRWKEKGLSPPGIEELKRSLPEITEQIEEILRRVLEGYQPGMFKTLQRKLSDELFYPSLWEGGPTRKTRKGELFEDISDLEKSLLLGEYAPSSTFGHAVCGHPLYNGLNRYGPGFSDAPEEILKLMEECVFSNPTSVLFGEYNVIETYPKWMKHCCNAPLIYLVITDFTVYERNMLAKRRLLDGLYEVLNSYVKDTET